MSLRAQVLASPGVEEAPSPTGTTGPRAPSGLDGLLGTDPCFRGALRGYDRMQVDNYVTWAESELALSRRESDHLLSRYAACSAELASARLRLAQIARERAERPRTDQAQQLLVQAAEHATAITAAAEAEAERIRDEARAEARGRLANVAGLRAAAVAASEQAAEAVAAAERDRAVEVAELQRQIAEIRGEADELRRQRDRAWESLATLREQVSSALQVVAGLTPASLAVVPDEHHPVAAGVATRVAS
jgi:colicin import membrane protein